MKVMGRMLSLNGGESPNGPEAQAVRAQPLPASNSFGLRRAVANRLGEFKWKIESVDTDPVRRIGFLFALAYLFARFSFISEGVLTFTGIPLYMNYWTGPPALIALLLCGGLKRGMQHKGAILLLLFAFWMAAAVPTSHWPGGSFGRVMGYLKY